MCFRSDGGFPLYAPLVPMFIPLLRTLQAFVTFTVSQVLLQKIM